MEACPLLLFVSPNLKCAKFAKSFHNSTSLVFVFHMNHTIVYHWFVYMSDMLCEVCIFRFIYAHRQSKSQFSIVQIHQTKC